MKTMINGVLFEKPKIKKITVNSKEHDVVETIIFLFENTNETKNEIKNGVICPVVAWNDNARYLSKLDKGCEISFVGQAKNMMREYQLDSKTYEIETLGYIVNKIDVNNSITPDIKEALEEFINNEEGEY